MEGRSLSSNFEVYCPFGRPLKADFGIYSFLILTTTFNTNSALRFSRGVLSIIIVAFLTGGYSLTLLLWFACPSLSFRLDSIFLPTASVSAFSFLAVCYLIASSSAYNPTATPCGITLALAATSATLYGALSFFTLRRMRQITRKKHGISRAMAWNALTGTPSISHSAPDGSPDATPWIDPGYYQNYTANMHPAAAKSSHASSDYPNATAGSGSPPLTEEDMVNQQMATLLRTQGSGPSPDPTQSTFRLEWPIGDDDEVDPVTGAMRTRTLSASGGRLVPPGQNHDRNRARSATGPMARLGRAMGITGDRGRTDSRHERNERAKSRELRRQEIELGNVAPPK